MEIKIEVDDLLWLFSMHDYPIRYKDGSYGRGMGYGDFEKLIRDYTESNNEVTDVDSK
jgi:hypothetical protein